MKTVKNIFVLALLIVHCTLLIAQSQTNTLDSLRNIVSELDASANKLPIKVNWDWMPLDSALSYDVYYCAADDSSLIPLKDGIDGSSVWDWQTGSTIYNYFWVKNPLMKYLKIGIVGVNQAGKATAMKCKTYVGF